MRQLICLLLGMLMLPAVGRAQTTVVTPPPAVGYGSLAVTGSSATILADLTTGPGSAVWPPPPGSVVYVINPSGSGGTVYVCPVGSTPTCTTNGVPVPAGTAYGFFRMSPTATVIGSTSLTAAVQW